MILIIDLVVALGCTFGVVFLFIAQFIIAQFYSVVQGEKEEKKKKDALSCIFFL